MATKNATAWQIEGYPNWRANGHRELSCACGGYKLARRISRDKNGRAVVRVEGECKTCGSITITSGKWRTAKNPRRFTRCLPGEEDQADWSFGNPLTFNDPDSRASVAPASAMARASTGTCLVASVFSSTRLGTGAGRKRSWIS